VPALLCPELNGASCRIQAGMTQMEAGLDRAMVVQEGGAAVQSAAAISSTSRAHGTVLSLHGAIRRVMRLAQHDTWAPALAQDGRVHAALEVLLSSQLQGRPLPPALVQGALWTHYYLLLASVQRVHGVIKDTGGGVGGMSQAGAVADVSQVGGAARAFVEQVHFPMWNWTELAP
jgi:hypothetical protein